MAFKLIHKISHNKKFHWKSFPLRFQISSELIVRHTKQQKQQLWRFQMINKIVYLLVVFSLTFFHTDLIAGQNSEELVNTVFSGDLAKIENLLNNGADPNSTVDGLSALMFASQLGKIDMVELLLKNGADPNITDPQSGSALGLAVISGSTEIVGLLLQSKADVNYRVSSGWSPLMFAANAGQLEIVKMMLSAGADRSFSDKYGWTAYKLAERIKNQELMDILK